LCLGKLGDAWVLASESCALDLIHAKFVRDVEPGEIVAINAQGLTSLQAFPEHERRAFCIFEYIYFARPDSTIANRNVYKARVNNLKEAGAKEVHVLVSCPPHMNPCVYGIDFPERKNLMAANYSLEEIRNYLNADSLHYLSEEGMIKATGLPRNSFCMACY